MSQFYLIPHPNSIWRSSPVKNSDARTTFVIHGDATIVDGKTIADVNVSLYELFLKFIGHWRGAPARFVLKCFRIGSSCPRHAQSDWSAYAQSDWPLRAYSLSDWLRLFFPVFWWQKKITTLWFAQNTMLYLVGCSLGFYCQKFRGLTHQSFICLHLDQTHILGLFAGFS